MLLLLRILLFLILLAVFLLLAALLRTLSISPTAAKTAAPPPEDPRRARQYGEVLSAMLRMETVSVKGQEDFSKFAAFQESLHPLFPHIFSRCEIAHPGEGLLIRLPARGEPAGEPILLMSHHDVVPAQAEGWRHGAFSGDIDADGVVWGRGAVDTKGALFCELQALEELIAAGWQPEKDVYIASSCTEEWGGPGAQATVQWLQARGVRLGMLLDEGGMILPDPIAGVQGRYCMVGALEKGSGSVRLVARGKGGHASTPPRNSPLVRLGRLMDDLERHSPFRAELTPVIREMFGRLAPNADFGFKYILTNLWLFGPLVRRLLPRLVPLAGSMLQTTCAFTMAGGSEAANVLPREAWVTANLRFCPHQDDQASLRALRQRAERFDVEVQVLSAGKPCPPVDVHGAPFRLLEETAARIYPGYDVVPYAMTANTDARFYTGICDHCLRFAPIEITQAQYASIHSVNECLNTTALPPAVDFYKQLLQDYCARIDL